MLNKLEDINMKDLLIERLEHFKGKTLIHHFDNDFLHMKGISKNYRYEVKEKIILIYDAETEDLSLNIIHSNINLVSEGDERQFFVFFDDRSSIHLEFVE